jgi:hypothetical protein
MLMLLPEWKKAAHQKWSNILDEEEVEKNIL